MSANTDVTREPQSPRDEPALLPPVDVIEDAAGHFAAPQKWWLAEAASAKPASVQVSKQKGKK